MKLSHWMWIAAAVYGGMKLQQYMLHKQGYSMNFDMAGKAS